MGQPTPPSPPSAGQSYESGIRSYLQYLPRMLQGEQAARTMYDPNRVDQQLALQAKFGPGMYNQQLAALKQLDPVGTSLHDQLGRQTAGDLALGGRLSPEMETQLNSQIRGAETVRGNVLGNAPIAAEGLWKGQAAANLYQQRLQNAGNFLGLQTPEQAINMVQPVQADRSSQYVNPSAGYLGQQFGLQNYQNSLAQYQLNKGQGGGWGGALGGAASGAAAGTTVSPGYGTAIGGAIGGVAGYFSDVRLKRDIVPCGTSPRGYKIVEFRYINDPPERRYRGVLAEDVEKINPSAVWEIGGYKGVDYGKTDVQFEQVGGG